MVPEIADFWGRLPLELIERILDLLIDDYDLDPAYQWTTLRHTARRQKRRIERFFWHYWLPKLTITLYSGPRCQIDYRLSNRTDDDNPESSQVRFRTLGPGLSNSLNKEDIRSLWDQYTFENRVAHLRLGEGLLNHGMTGGYIVNDTDIVDLQVEDDGFGIVFDWRRTFDALLREEVMMRKFQLEMTTERKMALASEHRWPPFPRIQRLALVKQFVLDVQMAKRVAVQKHRLKRHDPSGQTQIGSITQESRHLHNQPLPLLPPPTEPRRACCAICSRRTGPSIFEVVACEESVVLSLEDWQQLSKEELLDLYAEAYGWNCYRCLGQKDNVEWQQISKNDWLTVCSSTDEKLHSVRRWNPWF
ncbi:uncharacterized protein F4807DRAFT_454760 [Annulohypoxylon truncatum]|uniref:uncharacterized protein n=1 Tax=Annulohypoxylon truncatum TaxID=327061 RepID=UPI00200794A7|nr:uncharacterized protein F4807DRAFT_454760 [Annulohypoxylon truncatum]KAI1204306.1 hypothetical protein F4807DRAFT_454760 [Annulohypoxylon truncatum]